MIILKGDGIELKVEESNPVYKNLKRFVGEVFLVSIEKGSSDPEEKVREKPTKVYLQEETEAVEVQVPEYYQGINQLFPDEKSVVRAILTHQGKRFFGSTEKLGRYLAIRDTLNDDVILLARIIDNEPAYLSIKRELVTRI